VPWEALSPSPFAFTSSGLTRLGWTTQLSIKSAKRIWDCFSQNIVRPVNIGVNQSTLLTIWYYHCLLMLTILMKFYNTNLMWSYIYSDPPKSPLIRGILRRILSPPNVGAVPVSARRWLGGIGKTVGSDSRLVLPLTLSWDQSRRTRPKDTSSMHNSWLGNW